MADNNLFCSNDMLEKFEHECTVDYEKTTPLEVLELSNGIVHPLELSETSQVENNQFGGITDEDLNFINLSLTKRVSPPNFNMRFNDWYRGANPENNNLDFDYINEDVVFLGALPQHYGHFILEGLARLWFYLDSWNTKYKCVYISGDGKDRFNDCFKYFGLEEENIIKITKPTKFRTVIIPEQSIRLHDFYHIKYKETIDRIKGNIKAAEFEKVYFSKARITNNRAIGEASIQDAFSKNNFSLFYPETLSMYETISILKGCKVFAATSATNIHNSIFMDDGNTFVCLNRSAHFHPIQTMIEKMRNLKSIYVDVFIFSSDKNFGDAPCLLAPTSHLFDYFKEQGFNFNRTLFYVKFPYYIYKFITIKPRNFIFTTLYSRYVRVKESKWIVFRLIVKLIRLVTGRKFK